MRSHPKKIMSMHKIAVAVLYCAALIAIIVYFALESSEEETSTFGSLDGRFDSQIALEYNGSTYHYREREITNYLLIGIDSESTQNSEIQSSQADFLVLISIDRRNRTITPIMVDRDTIASVTTYGVFGNVSGEIKTQLCLAQAFHAKGVTGSDNTLSALSKLMYEVPIEHYVTVDLGGIHLLNDAIGGVEVTLEDDFSALDPAMTQGATVLLQGDQAEWFVRSRMTVADGTNASRMKRQKLYLENLLHKLFVDTQEKDAAIENALAQMSGHYETDMSEATLLKIIQKYDDYEWQPFVTLPGEYSIGEDGFTEFWLDEAGTNEIMLPIWFR